MCGVCGFEGTGHYDGCPEIDSKPFLLLEEDVAAMDIEPNAANELLRQLYRVAGVMCDARWMRSLVEKAQQSDPDF